MKSTVTSSVFRMDSAFVDPRVACGSLFAFEQNF
jgi:hypothetical protein